MANPYLSSLPDRWNNGQLAMQLIGLFVRFGPLVSVKASRDARGRPYGFVDFESPEAAAAAIAASSLIALDGRSLRIEIARTIRKLRLKVTSSPEDTIGDALETVGKRATLLKHAKDEGGDILVFQLIAEKGEGEDERLFLNKLAEDGRWTVAWWTNQPESTTINGNRGGATSIVRASGLVELLPPKLTRLPVANGPVLSRGRIYCVETQKMTGADESYPTTSTVYVGRLNGAMVTRAALMARFSGYGQITALSLFNRDIRGPGNVVVDAFAFLAFQWEQEAKRAIEEQDGSIWLGLTMKVQMRRVATPMIMGEYSRTAPPTCPAIVPIALYYEPWCYTG